MKLTISNHTLNVNGYKLALYISAKQQANTVVLLHGYCGSSAYFHKLIPLIEQYASVVAIDLFGHGESESLKAEKYNLDEVATLIHHAVTQLSLSNVYMLGHSLGGYITLAYAKQYSSHLKGYGLIHSTALPDSDEAKANRLNVIQTVKTEGVTAFTDQLVGKLFGEQPFSDDVELAKAIGSKTLAHSVIGFAHGMREREDRQDIIQNSELPVLLIAGQQDKIVSPDKVFSGHNNQTVCHIIKEAGHMGMLETQNSMSSAIQAFIGN